MRGIFLPSPLAGEGEGEGVKGSLGNEFGVKATFYILHIFGEN
jgi:hypothetical protein